MKKLTTFLIAALCVVSAFGQSSESAKPAETKATLCISVTGLEENVSDTFIDFLTTELSKNYNVISRNNYKYQETAELSESSCKLMCVVKVSSLFDSYYMFEANIIYIERALILHTASCNLPSLNSEDLKKAASTLTMQIQRKN